MTEKSFKKSYKKAKTGGSIIVFCEGTATDLMRGEEKKLKCYKKQTSHNHSYIEYVKSRQTY